MAVTAGQFARELRAFDDRRRIVKALRRALARTARPAVKLVRAHAAAILPSSGGLGAWVAGARIGVRIGYTSRTAGVRLRGGRKSLTDKSDLQAIDLGMVRAPSWGRRGRGAWHSQPVTPGWWSDPLAASPWPQDAEQAIDDALDEIRRG